MSDLAKVLPADTVGRVINFSRLLLVLIVVNINDRIPSASPARFVVSSGP